MVAGVANPTRRVIEAGLMTVGLAPGIATPSSLFLMIVPRPASEAATYVFADCAINADPGPEELADIAIASADSARSLLRVEPRVAEQIIRGMSRACRAAGVTRVINVSSQATRLPVLGEYGRVSYRPVHLDDLPRHPPPRRRAEPERRAGDAHRLPSGRGEGKIPSGVSGAPEAASGSASRDSGLACAIR